MGKKRVFEAILTSPLRWPAKGDRPFVVAADPSENANITDDGFKRLVLMTEGYKWAADLMVQATIDNRHLRDKLVFPIIFNYRQFVELSLKYQLATYGPSVGVNANWKTHDLSILWSEFLNLIDRYGTEDPDEVDPVVGQIILEFAKIDPGSYSYRYPVDLKGDPVPVTYHDLHLPTLSDIMQGVAGYFSGCDGFFGRTS